MIEIECPHCRDRRDYVNVERGRGYSLGCGRCAKWFAFMLHDEADNPHHMNAFGNVLRIQGVNISTTLSTTDGAPICMDYFNDYIKGRGDSGL